MILAREKEPSPRRGNRSEGETQKKALEGRGGEVRRENDRLGTSGMNTRRYLKKLCNQ